MDDLKVSDNESLQRAIKRAIAKEDGTDNPNPAEPERMWILRTPIPFIKPFRTKDPRAMQLFCEFVTKRYPLCPQYLFFYEIPHVPEPEQVYKVR